MYMLGMAQTPWTRLAARLIERWKREEAVAVGPNVAKLVEDLGDWLGSHAGQPDLGVQLGEWLVDHKAIEDVFADDDTLEKTVLEEAKNANEVVGAPEPDYDDELDGLDDLDDDDDEI